MHPPEGLIAGGVAGVQAAASPPATAAADDGFLASQRLLETGDVFAMEIDGRWGGYIGQVTQPAVRGELDSERRKMWKVKQEAVVRCYERLKLGATMGDFVSVGEEAARGTPFSCSVIIHSRGLDNDAPMVIFNSRDRRQLDWPILDNHVHPQTDGP